MQEDVEAIQDEIRDLCSEPEETEKVVPVLDHVRLVASQLVVDKVLKIETTGIGRT